MIGILGGTFDPIHFGHLRTALDVMQALALDQVRFIPLHRAVHRNQPGTSAELRLRMVRLAIEGVPGFVADDRELRRAGDSYTVDTLASLREELPREQPLCLLMGMDAFEGFADWWQPEEILRLAHLVVMQRPGQSEPQDPRSLAFYKKHRCGGAEALRRSAAGAILLQPVTQLDISATRIRALSSKGLSSRYLVPEPVRCVIEENRLYQG